MGKVTVYQFEMYDAANDTMRKSRRWGTREAIEYVGGHVLEETATQVDESVLGREVKGLSEIGFDPHAQRGPQTQVR